MADNFEEVGVEAVVLGFTEFILALEAMNLAIVSTGAAGAGSAAGVAAFSLALGATVAIVAAVVAGIGLLVGGFAALTFASANIARSVESAFAGVAKTTDGLVNEFGQMTEAGNEVLDQFREIAKEIPLALEELLGIGELAGQLGIAKEALAGFTEVVAALAVSTNLSAEQATLALARIANIYEVTAADMVENTERVGSAIVFLGNNFATTESEIADFAKRIAGVANIAGITQAEILGIGAAFTSVGIEAQAGGTAVQTVIIEMSKAVAEGGDNLETFAEVSGKTAEQFAADWESDAAGAFADFVAGLGNAGDDAFGILEDLGVADRRVIRAFLAVAGAGDLMTDAIDGSNQAFEDNTALAREVGIRYSTFDSQLQIFKNTIRDVGLEIGMVLLPFMKDILEVAGPIIEAIGAGLVPAFESIFKAITEKLLPAFGSLLEAFGFDISSASLTEGIANFGDKVAGGIEAFAGFVEDVAELVDLYKEGGIVSVAEHFGIEENTAQLFLDAGEAILVAAGAFIALKGAVAGAAVVAGVIGSISAALGGFGAAVALIASGEGVLATLGAVFAGVSVSASALILPIAALIGVIAVFGSRALESLRQLVIIGVVLIGQFIGDVATSMTEMWESIKVNTATAVETFLVAVTDWWTRTVATVSAWWGRVVEAVSTMWEQIKTNTSTAVGEFIQGIVDWKNRTVEKVVELWDGAVQAVVGWWGDMITTLNEKGAEWGVALGTWIVDMAKKLAEGVSKWVQAGREMMNGLLQGLKDNVNKVLDFIKDLATGILDTILGVFNITSPSKVFWDIGANLMKGLALGIDENADIPQIALDASAARMIAAEQRAMSGSSMASTSNTDRSMTINANYTKEQAPNTIADDMALFAMLEA